MAKSVRYGFVIAICSNSWFAKYTTVVSSVLIYKHVYKQSMAAYLHEHVSFELEHTQGHPKVAVACLVVVCEVHHDTCAIRIFVHCGNQLLWARVRLRLTLCQWFACLQVEVKVLCELLGAKLNKGICLFWAVGCHDTTEYLADLTHLQKLQGAVGLVVIECFSLGVNVCLVKSLVCERL